MLINIRTILNFQIVMVHQLDDVFFVNFFFNLNFPSQYISYQLNLYLMITCLMWPFFNVQLEGKLRQVWLYIFLRSHMYSINYSPVYGLVVWFMVFNTTFNNVSAISWRWVLWWRKPEYPEKTTDLSKVTLYIEFIWNNDKNDEYVSIHLLA